MPFCWLLVLVAALLLNVGAPAQADVHHTTLAQELDLAAAESRDLRVQLAQASDSPSMAVMQTRVQQLEEQIRRLTGRLERLEFEEGKLNTRIDRLVGDIDSRLSAIERQATAPAQPPADGPTALTSPAGNTGTTATPQQEPAPRATVDAAPGQPDIPSDQVLGTIPRDAVLGVPHPDETTGSPASPGSRPIGDPETRYTAALELLQTADLGSAEIAFTRFLDDHPDSQRAPEAAFWLGETYFARGDYPTAAATFARNYRAYGGDAPKAPDNLLKLGMSLAKLDDTERACQSFSELVRRYPDAAAPLRQAVERESARAGCS